MADKTEVKTNDNFGKLLKELDLFRRLVFDHLNGIAGEIRNINIPAIKIPTPEVLKPSLDKIQRSISALSMELPKDAKDAIPVRLSDGDKFYKALDEIILPAMTLGGGGSSIPTKAFGDGSTAGIMTSGLGLPLYDFVSLTLSAGNTTETYTFKSNGTVVATLVIVYTDSTRATISTVTKS